MIKYFPAFALIVSLSLPGMPAWAKADGGLNPALISELTGLKGQLNEKEGVYKVALPRGDIGAVSHGVKLTPGMGLTSWAAFQRAGHMFMMMGDTVLTEDQVNPVMSVALENGLEVTALHNHFFGDTPKVMFMHIGGMGSQEALASAVGKVYAKLKETMGGKGEFPETKIDPANSKLDVDRISEAFGAKGDFKDGILKFTIGRKTKMHGFEAGNAIGVNTWAAFAGTDQEAVVDGDFAMLETELQGVLRKLRGANINIVAIHNHMTQENPRIMFLHYWGVGPAANLAKGIRAALDTQKK
ncbi:MAG: DUF1259 domain-containing protein [Bdellovibrionota bacterium]